MPSFTHQLKVLLWKNCLNAYRQPIWSVVLILWPVFIFIILAITRTRFPPQMMSNCYLAPRSLQSAGLIPFLQTVLCNSDTTCSNSSYTEFPFTPRSPNRKKRYSVDTGGGRSNFLGENVTGDSASMWIESVVVNTSYTTESLAKDITVWKTAIKLFTSGDVKGALCLLSNSSTITQQSMPSGTDLQLLKSNFDNFCKSNMTMVDFVAQALLPQAISAISNATTKIETIQSNTALWDFLLMLPEWNSDYFNAELAMNISTGTAGLPDVHPCINFILTIERQVQNGTYSTVLSGLLKTLISQDPDNELKACISLYQWLPCEVGTSQCWPEVKEVFEISYWLMTSVINGTGNNACTFNGTNVICNNTVSLEYLFQSAMTLIRNVSEDTANLLRITQRVWVILKQNRIDELVLQNLQQKIAKEYPGDTILQNTLTELVDLLLNITESLVMEFSMNPQYLNISLGTVQKLLGQFNVPGKVMEGELMNISQALNNILKTIVQNIYYMDNLAGFVSSYNVSSLTMTELQFLIQTSLSIHSDWAAIYNDTTFLKIVSLINQPELRHILQVFQTLLNLDSSSTNVTTSLIESLSLLNQVLKTWNTSHSSLITEVYLEQITNFIHSNINLMSNLLNLNLYINGSQLAFLQSDSLQTFILDFLTPSNLQNIGPNKTNMTSAVFKILSTLISPQEQEILHKIESATVSLLNSVSICEKELNNCTRTLLELQLELIQFIMLAIHHNSSTQQTVNFDNALLQFQAPSSAQISVLNDIVSLLVCFQQSPIFSCNTPINIYKEILDVIVNLTLTSDQNPLTDPLVLQNFNNIQQVLGSVNLTKLLDHVQNVVNASECYSGGVQSLQCNLKMFFGLIKLFNELPFPQPLNDTLTLLFSINEAWSGELEGVSDIYQRLTYMYNLTQLALQNGSVLHEIHASLMNIVQTLEEVQLSLNSTQGSGKFIDNLLEMLQFSNINYTSPATSITQTYQKLEDIKKQLLVIQWYVLYLKNETENFSSSGNMYAFVAMTQLILNNILSSMNTNSFLPTTSNEILYALNVLETFPIVPSLQNLFNLILKNDVQNLENIFNHTVSALQIIFQDEFLNGTYLPTSLNEPIRNDTAFLLSLLQWYDPGSLANQSSTLIFVEKILLVMQSFLNDTAVIQTSNSNTFQSIYNFSQEFMAILYNVKHVGNVSVGNVDAVYQLFLQIWNTSQNVISLEEKFKNILYLSMQCISENILSSTSQNCSFKELLLSIQLMLNDSGCQVPLLVPDAKGDMDLNTVLEGGLISFFNQNMTGCSSEETTSMKEGLVCFIELLGPIITYLSRTNIPFGLNITLVQQMDASITIISEKLVENNMTCTAVDEHIIDNLKKVFDTLDIMVLLVSNQTQNGMQYSELWNETVNIVKFYISMQGHDLSNDKTFTILNDILSHLLTITSDGTDPWLKVLTVLETLANLSTTLDTSEQLSIFPQILNTVNKVASLADRALQAAVMLPNVYSSYIFNANSSVALLNVFKQWMSAQNVTSAKSCDHFLQSFLASGQNANLTGLEGNDGLFGNISMWTCSLIFNNDSIIDWTQELKSIIAIIVNVEQANLTRFAEVALEIITSFKDFINGTSKDMFDSLIASLSEAFKELVSSKKWIVYQAIRDFVNSLTSLVNEALINGSNNHILTAEKVTVGTIEAVSVLLKSLNVTGYETVLSFTSEIVQVYFSSRNSSLSMDDIFQKTLTPIVTFLQNNGFEKFIMQTLQSQVSSYNAENLQVLKIFQDVMAVVFNTIKGAASENELQPPYLTTNIILNMINTIVGDLNDTRLQETIFGNSKNITDMIAILANAVLQNNLQESNVSFSWVLPPNQTSQTIHNLEVLINNLISKSGFDPSFYLNSSASFVKILYHLYEQDHKEQLIQMLNYILNNSNPNIDSILVNALGNLHDLIHLNYTNNQNMVQELYLKQLLNFLSDSKLHITLMELSPLLNLSHSVPFLPNKDLRDFSIELLEFLHPLNLYNIGNDQKNLTSVLFNLLSNYTPQTQGNFRNISIALVTVMEILQQCDKDAEICISAIPLFQNSVAEMADALNSFAMYNGETSLNISLVQLEMLDKSEISLINNVFLALWYAQENFSNFSGDILDVYQEFLSASQLIVNITRDLNVKTFESDLEIVRNDLNQMNFIMQVLAKSNMIESLLQIINIQQGPCCLNQTDVDCLLCTFNLTSHFLSLLQNLGLSAPLKERIEIMHSLVDYWMSEVSTATNVYQQIIIFYENTKVTLQNEPTLHNLLITLSNISLTLEEFKMDNMTSNVKQTLDTLSELLQPDLTLDLFNITFNMTSDYLEKVQAQLEVLQWYLMYIKNQTGNHNVSGEIYPMYRLTQAILSNTILNWVDLNNSSVIGYILDKIKLSPEEADTFFKQLSQLFSGNQSNLLDQKIWAEILHFVTTLKPMTSLSTSVSPEFTTIWQIVDKILVSDWNITTTNDVFKDVQMILTNQNVSIAQGFLQAYDVVINILNLTHSGGNMNFTQLLDFSVNSFSTMDCRVAGKLMTVIFQAIRKGFSPAIWPEDALILNVTIDICDLLHWNNSQDDWAKLLQFTRNIAASVESFMPDNSTKKYFDAAEIIITSAAELVFEPTFSQATIVSIMNIVPAINELFGIVEKITFQHLFYTFLDLATSTSSPKEILLLKLENFILEAVQPIQEALKAENDSSYNIILSFSLEALKQFINMSKDTSLEDNIYIPFMKQMWALFRNSSLEDLIISKVNQLALEDSPHLSKDPTIWGHFLQLLFNVTDLVISETSSTPPYITIDKMTRILQTVLEDILTTFLPQSESITDLLEQSFQVVLNVTRVFLEISEQNKISQLKELINSITNMTLSMTDLSNDTAKLFHLFSVINQTGLIPQIDNTLNIIFNSGSTEEGKLFLNALGLFNELIQMKDISNVHELSSIFSKYMLSSLQNGNQTQKYLNTVLNILLYLNHLSGEGNANLDNGLIDVFPLFVSTELQHLSSEVINQAARLLHLIADYIPSEEQENFQKVSNISLQLIESIHNCSVTLNNCTDLTKGIQNFLWDIIQLQAVIQNGSLEGHFANSSFLQIGSYDSFQKTLINDIYTLFSYSLGHPHNSSVFVEDVYDEVLAAVHWVLNTSRDNQNMSILSSLESVIEVLTSANISEFIHQTENMVFAALCIDQEDTDPLLCSLDLTYQLTQLLKLLPWTQPMHNRLSIISTVAAQWLSTINVNVSASQQLIHLYNATLLMYQHQPILHAINTSAVNIIQMLQESGNLLNVTVNGAGAAVNLLSVILQAGDFEATKYNISDVLTYNISDLLESIRLQLDVVQLVLLQVTNKTAVLESNPGAYVMHTITQWILENYQQINLVIRDAQSVIASFNSSVSLMDLIHIFGETLQGEQFHILIQQIEAALLKLPNSTFYGKPLLNHTIVGDILMQLPQLTLNLTNMIISETSLSSPSITSSIVNKILETVMDNIMRIFLPQTGNIKRIVEESLENVLNVTKIILYMSEQNEISQLYQLVNSLTTLTFGVDLSNDTAKLAHLFSVMNQTGLIPQIANTLQIIFNSDNMEQGKLILNALDMFNNITQMKDINNIHELSSIFTTYLPSSLVNVNQTQRYLNVILNLLLYFNNIPEEHPASLTNGVLNVLPFFLSPDLQNLGNDIINQSSGLLGLLADYIPSEEQDNFQKVSNISLQLIESIHNCSVSLDNCTDLTQGIQNFLWDIIQLQAMIQNGSLEEHFANSSFLQIGSYDSFQKTLINDIYTLFSYSLGHPYNSSVFVEDVYDEVLAEVHWLSALAKKIQTPYCAAWT
ncbi:uncharacterized protein LOC128502227 [Spea bombifrons]|uniref:uncharacterized protein LOC128502227 n=1 Tax=Spea bombifrons TaxID=233779 RepID=UPI0023498E72|nr:uncharacterized protein LOC128502227 [Spea bombifrons]